MNLKLYLLRKAMQLQNFTVFSDFAIVGRMCHHAVPDQEMGTYTHQ